MTTLRLLLGLLALLLGTRLLSPARLGAQQVDSARAAARAPADSARRKQQARPARRVTRPDSLAAPVSPGKAFLYSLLLPGLGQSKLQRPSAGALYFSWEAIGIAMASKAAYDLRVAKVRVKDIIPLTWVVDPSTGAPVIDPVTKLPVIADTLENRYAPQKDQLRSRVKARRLHFEDWIATLAFTHLFAGADAFVSSQLWDFPAEVELRVVPRGVGVGAAFRFR